MGPDHYALGVTHLGQATLYQAQSEYEDAVLAYEEALEILKRSLGGEHPLIMVGMLASAALKLELGKYSEAETDLTKALAIADSFADPTHPLVGAILSGLVKVSHAQEKPIEPELERKLGFNMVPSTDRFTGSGGWIRPSVQYDSGRESLGRSHLRVVKARRGSASFGGDRRRSRPRERVRACGRSDRNYAGSYRTGRIGGGIRRCASPRNRSCHPRASFATGRSVV